jgi:NADH-quinone oxidoreductase subunit G
VKGLNAGAMARSASKAFILLNQDPGADSADPSALKASLKQAKTVIALSAFYSAELAEHADCLLPIAPFTETAGSFVNTEGRLQSFNGVVTPAGDSRPAWKVLRVLANLLECKGFDFDSAQAVREEALGGKLDSGDFVNEKYLLQKVNPSKISLASASSTGGTSALERVAEIGLYSADPIVRRAQSLQQTADAKRFAAEVHPDTLASLGLLAGAWVDLKSPGGSTSRTQLQASDKVAVGALRWPTSNLATSNLPLSAVLQVAGRAP